MRTVFPPLLAAVRRAGMRVYHIVPGGMDVHHLPGYQRALQLAGPKPTRQRIKFDDPVMASLQQFRRDHVLPGQNNLPAADTGPIQLGFQQQSTPWQDEGVVETSEQLIALLQADGINHLVYCGFTINVCIQTAPSGMVYMSRAGAMCSAIRQAVTAMENRQSVHFEAHKEHALWNVAVNRGFIFDLNDFVEAISEPPL
jgi:nicotinamidase-related amidase